ncbi:GTPase Era [Anderseniella sp. Alg231-50]|uniref:GTPase Era n=1 Tax=Anderseniella sp. Alg231-50 TaxID=1922226 RepID=UPI000D55D9C9
MTKGPADIERPQDTSATSCGFVALIGAPNAGKSTLLNQLVGSKISIVTHKVQTTRARIRAIALEGTAQIIFVDTPGIFSPKRKLDEEMVHAAWAGAADADATVLLIGARDGLNEDNMRIIEGLEATGAKAILAINKIDLVPHENLLQLAADLNARYPFTDTFMISALKGHGVADLRVALAGRMPKGPWLYPEDQIADVPLRMLASEITREKLYLRLHDELPYASTVETEKWTEKKDGSVRIEQVIYVQRDSQKKIVLGKNGQTIKKIGQSAREEITETIGQTAHLFLFVKVREKWADDPERLRMMGLEPR